MLVEWIVLFMLCVLLFGGVCWSLREYIALHETLKNENIDEIDAPINQQYDVLRERLVDQLEDLHEGASYNYIKTCIEGIKTLSENEIGFVPLENAIKQIQGRRHNLVYLFLDQPLNTKGIFFDYLCEMIGRNTTVIMYTSEDNVDQARIIKNQLIKVVGKKAATTYFEYPEDPNDAFLLINCVIIDPRLESQRVYLAIRGMDGGSIVALEMPSCASTHSLVDRAEMILNLNPKIKQFIQNKEGAA